ncbi:MAG TPA: PDZ domain-containing protein [Thermoanaerobaculia bacterium]|nr:PDZ domain-containing protein [Thermoanaerobaculia bacterium]
MRLRSFLAPLLLLVAAPLPAQPQQNLTRLLRQPDLHADQVAFVYGGDIWVGPATGGTARRLTSHDGLEQFPKFSPDGRFLAFTGEYSGTSQVHVIPVDGGEPRQLTFYNDVGPLPPRGGVDNRVVDWTPDGKNILFLPHRLPWSERMGVHYTISFDGGMEAPVGIPEGSGGSYSPDGTKIAYTPIEREFRTWKRYRGGRAQDVWIWDVAAKTARQITNDPATDNQPAWIGGTIYFTSDRAADQKLNLWAHDLAANEARQVTFHDDFDVLWPSTDGKRIVYEAGGSLWIYDPARKNSTELPMRVYGDFRNAVPRFANVKSGIQSADLSPSGARALFGARGDVFTVPAKEGEIRNLTQTPGIREMQPVWSPDGKSVAYLSDRTGEYEIWVRPADGTGAERQVTRNGNRWRFPPVWSPDSRKLAFADKNSELHIADASTGALTRVDRGVYADITDYVWAPDSRWLAYTMTGENRLQAIHVHSVADGTTRRLTSGMTNDYAPAFDPKGRYLYFVSDRDFNLTFSGFEFDYLYTNPSRVYVGLLSKNGPALFLPTSDEEKAKAAAAPATEEKEEKKEDAKSASTADAVKVTLDFDGFESRVRAIPGSPGNYRSLSAIARGVLYLVGDDATSLRLYDIDAKKEETILEGIQGYVLAANGEKLLFQKGGDYGVAETKPAQKADAVLDLKNLEMKIDPRQEWVQEFNDAWRILRDWFYDPNMHGVDWNLMRERYGALVPHVSHRADLDYVLGELAGELDAGHVYVGTGGDWQIRRADNALLGAVIERDASGYYRIAKIFPGENWHEDFRSPLTEPGVNVKQGDYILAVDGVSTKTVDNFYRLLENKANQVLTLRVGARPAEEGAREERVRPIAQETNLRYLDWVQSRRDYVAKKSGGRIGYIHLPNTAVEGNRELFKGFYPQATKDALVIDVRYNGGGFIPDRMIEVLDRPVLSYWARRNVQPMVTPGFAHTGPKAVLINGYSSSGGDAFPYYFKKRGLGPLIGTRTWGGLIGISGQPSLMDGGSISAPSFRFFDTEGMWAVEDVGVSPDIEVVDRPDEVARGIDPSLDKAIEVLMEELRKNPPAKLVVPVPPGRAGAP